ncbi:MAG: hypothetical protein K0U38_03845 [Epsilonproteobacteria bacterium]|nr:hypothetical protein [Campylobacterota bacterium]
MKILAYLSILLALIFCIYRCNEELKGLPSNSIKQSDKKIFIIGDSTVRYDYDEKRVGWGTALIHDYMVHPNNGFNEARRGATAQSYKMMNDKIQHGKGAAYWTRTKQLIQNTPNTQGGYLLIQFGANDKIQKVPQESFVKALKSYIDEAKAMKLIPVLISPVNTRLKIKGKAYYSRGAFPFYIESVAKEENVLYLNLNAKSFKVYSQLSDEELAQKFGAIPYPNGRVDKTHFNANGAKVVAGWVKELACEQDEVLCSQFSLTERFLGSR